MKRTQHETATRKFGKYTARITLCTLWTPDLGEWQVYEWEVFEGKEFVDCGSFQYGASYILIEDVVDQLEYLFIDRYEMEPVYDSPSDADPGL